MNKVLSNTQRSKNAIIAFYILLAMYAISLFSNYLQYDFLTNFVIFDANTFAKAEANDQRQQFIAIFLLLSMISVMITFIQWMRRAYHNLHKAQVKGLEFSEGWAAGAWFVPFMNLVRPYKIMREIWLNTRQYAKSAELEDTTENLDEIYKKANSSVAIIGWWWAIYLISNITDSIAMQFAKEATVPALMQSTTISMVGDVLNIVAIIIAIKMIRESQVDQNRFFSVWSNKKDDSPSTFDLTESDEILD